MTRAEVNHLGSKIGAAMHRMYVVREHWTAEHADNMRDDVCAHFLRGFASEVRLQFVDRDDNVRHELRFAVSAWDGTAIDQSNGGYHFSSTDGLEARIIVMTTTAFDEMSRAEKDVFYHSLSGSWGPAKPSKYAAGSWSASDRTHVKDGHQLTRSVFMAGA